MVRTRWIAVVLAAVLFTGGCRSSRKSNIPVYTGCGESECATEDGCASEGCSGKKSGEDASKATGEDKPVDVPAPTKKEAAAFQHHLPRHLQTRDAVESEPANSTYDAPPPVEEIAKEPSSVKSVSWDGSEDKNDSAKTVEAWWGEQSVIATADEGASAVVDDVKKAAAKVSKTETNPFADMQDTVKETAAAVSDAVESIESDSAKLPELPAVPSVPETTSAKSAVSEAATNAVKKAAALPKTTASELAELHQSLSKSATQAVESASTKVADTATAAKKVVEDAVETVTPADNPFAELDATNVAAPNTTVAPKTTPALPALTVPTTPSAPAAPTAPQTKLDTKTETEAAAKVSANTSAAVVAEAKVDVQAAAAKMPMNAQPAIQQVSSTGAKAQPAMDVQALKLSSSATAANASLDRIFAVDAATILRLAGASEDAAAAATTRETAARRRLVGMRVPPLPLTSSVIDSSVTSQTVFEKLVARGLSNAPQDNRFNETQLKAVLTYLDLVYAQARVALSERNLIDARLLEERTHSWAASQNPNEIQRVSVLVAAKRHELLQARLAMRAASTKLGKVLNPQSRRMGPGVTLVSRDQDVVPTPAIEPGSSLSSLVSEAMAARLTSDVPADQEKQIRMRISGQVRTAFAASHAQLKRIDLAQEKLALAEIVFRRDVDSLRNVNERSLEAIHSFNSVTKARLDHLSAVVSYNKAELALLYATGR